jgi:UDP-glucose 4-epimerase
MKFLVTGGLGFIGSHLTEYLINQGHSVVIMDNLHSGKLENLANLKDKVTFHRMDILEYDKLRKTIKDVDGIFHEAALTVVQESFDKQKEYDLVNVTGTENIFKIAQELRIKVVFASSAAVYGDVKKIPISEDFERIPLNPYGETKLKAELIAEKYSQLGASIIGLRYFNVYGPRQNIAYAGVITKFLTNIVNDKPPLIYGDGLQVRDFVYVGDVVRANLIAMKSNTEKGFFNIGSGIKTSLLDLAEIIIHASGLSLKPIHTEPLKGDIRLSQADILLANSYLGWKPIMKLKNWIDESMNYKMQ